jgi:hypothetical protein
MVSRPSWAYLSQLGLLSALGLRDAFREQERYAAGCLEIGDFPTGPQRCIYIGDYFARISFESMATKATG